MAIKCLIVCLENFLKAAPMVVSYGGFVTSVG